MIWNETTHVKKRAVRTACSICVYHAAVGELYLCEKLPRDVVSLAMAVKTEDTEKVVSICHGSSVGIELGVCLV